MGKRIRAKNKKRARDVNAAVKKGTAPKLHKSSAKQSRTIRNWRIHKMS